MRDAMIGDRPPAFGARRPGVPDVGSPVCVRPVWAVVLLGLGYVGYFKGSPVLASTPIDLTLACAVGTACACVATIVTGRHGAAPAPRSVLALWLTFTIGAAGAALSDVGAAKSSYLFSITLTAALAPFVLLSTARSRSWWIYGNVGAAALMSLCLLVYPNLSYQATYGRLTPVGISTVESGRTIGAGVLVCFVLALSSKQRLRLVWLAAGAAGVVLMLTVGSRGPLLSTVIAIVITMLLSKAFAQSRFIVLPATIGAVVGLGWLLYQLAWRSTLRLTDLLNGTQVDTNRRSLYGEAASLIEHHPLGVGWGGFGQYQAVTTGSYPHNIFLEITVEGGWLAGLAMIAFVAVALRRLLANSVSRDGAILFGLAVYWLLAAQTSSDVNGNRLTWTSLAIGFVYTMRAHPEIDPLRSARQS